MKLINGEKLRTFVINEQSLEGKFLLQDRNKASMSFYQDRNLLLIK